MKKLFLTAALMGLFMISCAKKPLYLTEQDNGKTFNVKQGSIIKIALRSNPTTGYDWYIKKLPDNLVQEGDVVYKQDRAKSGVVGVGGTTTFTFRAKSKGEGTLVLVYKRNWEGELPNTVKFAITINVN